MIDGLTIFKFSFSYDPANKNENQSFLNRRKNLWNELRSIT